VKVECWCYSPGRESTSFSVWDCNLQKSFTAATLSEAVRQLLAERRPPTPAEALAAADATLVGLPAVA
jgi:hypothetical protein